jgi:hypothetical protein
MGKGEFRKLLRWRLRMRELDKIKQKACPLSIAHSVLLSDSRAVRVREGYSGGGGGGWDRTGRGGGSRGGAAQSGVLPPLHRRVGPC